MSTQIDEAVARKVLNTIDAGLCSGLGEPKPGSMCVMAAINYAMGNDHGDRPTCVGGAVRAFDIAINDADWSSNEARARGMRREAIAKLGSDGIDQVAFASYMALHTIKRLLPTTLRAAGLEAEALLCEQAGSLADAESAAWSAAESAAESAAKSAAAWSAAWSAESAAWSAAKSAKSAKSAAWSAKSAAWSAAWSAESAAKSAKSAAAWSAAESAKSAAKSAKSAAAWSAAESALAKDAVYILACDIATEALIACGSEGAKWLWLCDEVQP